MYEEEVKSKDKINRTEGEKNKTEEGAVVYCRVGFVCYVGFFNY